MSICRSHFGQNYAGARDNFIYVYSQDNDSAYKQADRMVLARVAKDLITDRGAYEFFVRVDEAGQPHWTKDIAGRGAAFVHPGRCYRSGISYNAALKRLLGRRLLFRAEGPTERRAVTAVL